MADREHLEIINRGINAWNCWRADHPEIVPDLSCLGFAPENTLGARLIEATGSKHKIPWNKLNAIPLHGPNLRGIDLRGARLSKADLSGADFRGADLREATLREATLVRVNLFKTNGVGADLRNADLRAGSFVKACFDNADLTEADLYRANMWSASFNEARLENADLSSANLNSCSFIGATLKGANLRYSRLVETALAGANLEGCHVYGISAWDTNTSGARQTDLIITKPGSPPITVDKLEVAQFIYLLLNNSEIRGVIDTITSKIVLILGRFTPERKVVLDVMREELRRRNFLPVMFDFDIPLSRDTDETVNLLARMARFVIADITDAKSIPQELKGIVEALPSVPVQPLIATSGYEYGMFDHIKRYPWVLKPIQYANVAELMKVMGEGVIGPAEAKAKEMRMRTEKLV
jgi:uncharacterized protein YjbI with pentapeptide repeats